MIRVINFSGGKTSALMTILLKPTKDDIVLFTDTGREHKKTYKFLNDFEAFEGIKVHRASYTHWKSPGLTGFDALMNWKTFLPNRAKRLCTDELKVKTSRRYLRGLRVREFESYIGFRFDEKQRIDNYKNEYVNTHPKYILYDMGITSEMVDQYWLTKPYTLELPRILGNCDLCFLKGKDAIIRILQLHPELADPWIADETRSKNAGFSTATFIKDIRYERLLDIAKSQKSLFDLAPILPAYNCSCTN